jgi:uncharacterized membrane protein
VSGLGIAHFTLALASLALGAAVFVLTVKGSRFHRQVGWVYVACMLATNISALMIYRLFRGFGPFHVAAIINLVTLSFGTIWALRARARRGARDMAGRGRAVSHHYHFMAYTYVGICAAAVAETLTRLPVFRIESIGGAFFALVGIASVVVFIVGAFYIRRMRVGQVGRFLKA